MVDAEHFLHLFFFQAEDGIRDFHVTGVQTCALPISPTWRGAASRSGSLSRLHSARMSDRAASASAARSEERRVGKECRSRWSPYQQNKKLLIGVISELSGVIHD